jgi:hypothetical protein
VKALLVLVLIASFSTLQQVDRAESDLQVIKFSWAKEKQNSRMIRGAQHPGGPITTPVPDGRDLGSRRVDLRTMEKQAAGTGTAEKPADNYQLRLELKNNGANVVKGLVWEFRPTAGPEDYQPKQYLCAFQVKPNEKKILDIWTPYVPSKVVSVDERKDALKDGTVVINEIEYADGSVWKKHGWNYRLPPNSLQKLTEGACSVF